MTAVTAPDPSQWSQLRRLAEPFPPSMVSKKERADYVNHGLVTQRLLGTIGPYKLRIVQIVRGDFDEVITSPNDENKRRIWPGRTNAIVGVIQSLECTIDDEPFYVEEVGTPEGYYMAPHDGERLKKACSDAIKRCGMRAGVALDLWSKGAYFLPAMLDRAWSDAREGAVDDSAADPDDAQLLAEGIAEGIAAQASADSNGERPVADVVNPAVTSEPRSDPGPNAYPGDDPNRKGADREHQDLVADVERRGAELLQDDVINEEQWGDARVYARRSLVNAQAMLARFDQLKAARNDDLDRFHRWEMANLTEAKIDKKMRHDLARVVSIGRTEATNELSQEERRQRVAIVNRFKAETLRPAYGDRGNLILVNAATGEAVDAWKLP